MRRDKENARDIEIINQQADRLNQETLAALAYQIPLENVALTVRQLTLEPPAGYDPEVGRWLAALEECRRRTKRYLDGLDPAAVDWLDPQIRHSIGTLLYHMAAVEADWLYTDVMQQALPAAVAATFPHEVYDAQGRLTIVRAIPLDGYLELLDATRARFLDAFREMTLADFRRPREFPDRQVTPEWVIQHLIQHESEHRSELWKLRTNFEKAVLES
ncbi:MAG: DinB family protein [Chloroflexota bacterium]